MQILCYKFVYSSFFLIPSTLCLNYFMSCEISGYLTAHVSLESFSPTYFFAPLSSFWPFYQKSDHVFPQRAASAVFKILFRFTFYDIRRCCNFCWKAEDTLPAFLTPLWLRKLLTVLLVKQLYEMFFMFGDNFLNYFFLILGGHYSKWQSIFYMKKFSRRIWTSTSI